jgi:thiamine biosynthesis lipoprotein
MQSNVIHLSRRTLIGVIALVAAAVSLYCLAVKRPADYEIGGKTMGTTYSIKIADSAISPRKMRVIKSEIEDLLSNLNGCLSTYDSISEISRFNSSQNTNSVGVSLDTAAVARFALEVAHQTDGAFDPTVMPLVSLWGFGPDLKVQTMPSPADIKECMQDVGYKGVTVGNPPSLAKSSPQITFDFSAVAKGYAVDRIAALLVTHGFSNVFVEVGGEVSAVGASSQRNHWRIAIDSPREDTPSGQQIFTTIQLRNECVATSGDYRNYFKENGRAFSHVLDPRTGYPVSNGVASATVVAQDCMTADALATAIMVLGPQAGLNLIEKYDGAETLIILRTPDGNFTHRASPGFARHVDSSRFPAFDR